MPTNIISSLNMDKFTNIVQKKKNLHKNIL